MKLPGSIIAGTAAACMMLCGSAAQAQSSIANIFPDGSYQFQSSGHLSFTAASAAGITNVSVQLTAATILGQSSFKTLTAGHGLTVTGASTSETVTAILGTNQLYTAVINVADANGSLATTTVTFDTILPNYTWEAEDWDFTSNSISGLFIDNPQTNAYAGLATTDGVDAHNNNGGTSYRPVGTSGSPGGLSTEGAGDKTRVQYIGSGKTDYDVGFTDGGDFGNYTRTYPAGTYYVFMRGADGGGQASDSASISVQGGTAALSAAGTVSVPNIGGWQAYSWVPFKDSGGNLVTVTFDGTPSTLRVATDGGSYNANFYLLLNTNSISTAAAAADAAIINVYPNGAFQFQATNTLSFTVNSSLGVNLGDVVVNLAATNLAGAGSSQILGNGSGLTITGPSTSLVVTAPLASNEIYTVSIQVTDANGNGAVTNVTFDTITPGYTFEAEDWDYSSGLYVDNPQIDAYAGVDGGVAGIDQNCPGNVHSFSYRGGVETGFGLNTEPNGDVPRLSYSGQQDYDVGFTAGGNWGNYTRHYPAGVYNIYVRASRGDGGSVTDAGSVGQVTAGYGTSSQTVNPLGKYSVASTGNWQKYGWNPVLNNANALARFTTDGSLQTLRVTVDGGGHNQNFVMLLPADLTQNPPPFVSLFQPDSTGLYQSSNVVTFVVNSSVGIPTNNIILNLDGANVSGLSFTGSSALWTVSSPVKTNAFHTAIITMTDAVGTVKYTNSFTTFSPDNFTWEAEDYDFGGGQFFDNQLNAYSGLGSTPDVDNHQADLGANPFTYRLNSPAPSTGSGDVGGELPRAQFTSGGGAATDYDIGFFGGGSWANYTRHYPAGTYNVIGRFAEGQALTQPTLSLVTSGAGTTNQTTSQLGTFTVNAIGWSTWEWAPLLDASGNQARVTLDGSATTLRYSGSSVAGQPELNTGFFMLVPTTPYPLIKATSSGGNIHISFLAQNGYSYQIQYKNHLSDVSWTSLGSSIPGDNTVHIVDDPTTADSRFYRVQIQ